VSTGDELKGANERGRLFAARQDTSVHLNYVAGLVVVLMGFAYIHFRPLEV